MGTDFTRRDFRESFPAEKSDALWTRFVLRPVSFPLAWLCVYVGLSANHVTYLSIVAVFLGAALFTLESYVLAVVGAVLFNLFALLDCVDGNIARTVAGENPFGEWVDALGGYLAYTLLFISAGVFIESTYNGRAGGLNFILVGAIAATTNLLLRIQFQKLTNLRGSDDESSSDSIQKMISRNVGITGVLMPATFVTVVVSALDWLVLFYAVFYSAAWAVVTGKQIYEIEEMN